MSDPWAITLSKNNEVHLDKAMVAQLISTGRYPIWIGDWGDGTPAFVTLTMDRAEISSESKGNPKVEDKPDNV